MKQAWDISYIKEPKLLPNGKWSVYGVLPHRDENGKRKRVRKEGFGSKAEAEAYREEQQQRGRRYQMGGNQRWTRLDDVEEADAINAIKVLETKFPNKDRSLTDAAMFYVTQYIDIQSPKIDEAVDRYLGNPKMDRVSEKHQYICMRRLKCFYRELGNLPVDQYTENQIEQYIYDKRKRWGVWSRQNEYKALNAFFNWCVKKKLLLRNPCTAVDKPEVPPNDPVALTVPEVRSLMEWAEKAEGGAMVPYFCLAIFSAMRPAEILRLDWSDFNWDDKVPCVSVDGKGNKRRTTDLHPTCVAWLQPYIKLEGPVAPKTAYPELFRLVRALAGWREYGRLRKHNRDTWPERLNDSSNQDRPKWVKDVMRHTGITYYYMLTHDKPRTAAWAGNTPGIIDRHYRAVKGVTQGSCEEFWNILPDGALPDSKGVDDLVA